MTMKAEAYREDRSCDVGENKAVDLVIEIMEGIPRRMLGDIESAILSIILVHERDA
jgi:hypothetical protein